MPTKLLIALAMMSLSTAAMADPPDTFETHTTELQTLDDDALPDTPEIALPAITLDPISVAVACPSYVCLCVEDLITDEVVDGVSPRAVTLPKPAESRRTDHPQTRTSSKGVLASSNMLVHPIGVSHIDLQRRPCKA